MSVAVYAFHEDRQISGGRVHYSAQPDITMADAIFKRTDVDAHASTSTLASLQVHTILQLAPAMHGQRPVQHPPRIDGSAAGAIRIDIQHLASRRGCTGGDKGRKHGRQKKALSAIFVSRTSPSSWKLAHVHVELAHVQMNPASRASPKRDACHAQLRSGERG